MIRNAALLKRADAVKAIRGQQTASKKQKPPKEAAFQTAKGADRGYFCICNGVPGRIRTRDPLLRRQPLCPLSYWDSDISQS